MSLTLRPKGIGPKVRHPMVLLSVQDRWETSGAQRDVLDERFHSTATPSGRTGLRLNGPRRGGLPVRHRGSTGRCPPDGTATVQDHAALGDRRSGSSARRSLARVRRDLEAKQRGLHGVQLVISDQHAGLVAVLGRVIQGVGHQRAASTSPGAYSPWCRSHTRMWSAPCSGPTSLNLTPKQLRRSGTRSRPARRYLPQDRAADGHREGRSPRLHRLPPVTGSRTVHVSGSTERSDDGPVSSASSRTRPVSSASSEPSSTTSTTNGKSSDRRYLSEGSMAKLRPRPAILDGSPKSKPATDIEDHSKPTTQRGSLRSLGGRDQPKQWHLQRVPPWVDRFAVLDRRQDGAMPPRLTVSAPPR